jgi:cell division protein DivIC
MVLAVTAVIVVYFLATGVVSTLRSHQLHQREARLEAEIEQMRARHERLEALKEYLNSEEYIETVAREQLGLVREGETGFVAISTVPVPTPGAGQAPPELWWDVLIR